MIPAEVIAKTVVTIIAAVLVFRFMCSIAVPAILGAKERTK